jgi:protein-disulfide isomerase
MAGPARADAPGKGADIPGVDVSDLTESERASLQQLLEKFPSVCGKSHSLLVSLRTDPKCRRSPIAARWLHKLLKDGFLPSEIEDKYQIRYLKQRFDIDTAGAAVRGDPKAPITLVEFSDFECPHCRMAEPMLKKVLEEFPSVKLVFMNYPLPMHQNAPNAAAAALAAGKQNKFWAYHDKLFEHQDKLGPADLIQYAQELHLDLPRFQADMEGARVRVAKERSIGEKMEIDGTPAFFINGRRYNDANTVEAIRSWIEEEQAR